MSKAQLLSESCSALYAQRRVVAKQKYRVKTDDDYNHMTIEELEGILSRYEPRTVNYTKYMDYLRMKVRFDEFVYPFYNQEKFRIWEGYKYRNNRRSDQCFVNAFQRIYGGPKKTYLCVGHYCVSKRLNPNNLLLKVLNSAGYEIYIVREDYTSQRCANCRIRQAKCENVRRQVNPAHPDGPGAIHGMLQCPRCTTVWDRDIQGVINIGRVHTGIEIGHRPDDLPFHGDNPTD